MTNEIQTKQGLETIVIEDTPEFLAVAKKVYEPIQELKPMYFSNYESAIDYIKTNKDKIERVVTDLFFPSQTDWRDSNLYSLASNSRLPKIEASENPSGLGIAKYCAIEKIPFVIVSQGNRHKGNLAKVREGINCCRIDNDINFFYKTLKTNSDPYTKMSIYNAFDVDKGKEQTWIDALDGNNSQEKIKSLLHLAKNPEQN